MNPSGPIFSSTTGNDQIDELNRILMVERELVIKTQENYRNLKKQYLDLSKEYDQLRFSNSPRGRENIQQLEEKSEQILRNMQKDCEDREIRNERFKVETLEELQNVFRKELFEQNGQIEKLRNDRNDLVKENDELLTEIMDLKTEIDDMKRREKSKEAEMRKHFDEKLKTILDETQNKVSPRLEHYNNVISQLQEQIHSLESKILEKTQEFGKCIEDKNLKLETNRKTENELKTRIYDLEFEIERLKAEKIERKNIEQSEDSQKKILNQKIEIYLNDKIEMESKSRKMEREYEKRLENNEEKFAKQIVDFERICRKKDEEIEGLHNQLERFEGIQIALEQSEKNQLIDQEHRERLEIEVKMLYKKMDELGEEKTQYCAKLKNERDSLEQSVTHLKKQLETTPDSLAEVTKLRKTLKDMERKSAKEKEKYQRALSEMKTALTIIEKQQRSTQNKIRENFGNVTF